MLIHESLIAAALPKLVQDYINKNKPERPVSNLHLKCVVSLQLKSWSDGGLKKVGEWDNLVALLQYP